MGDSDDEYDRKRRDKFRGERSAGGGGDSYGRGADRPDRSRGRDDWPDRYSKLSHWLQNQLLPNCLFLVFGPDRITGTTDLHLEIGVIRQLEKGPR